MRFSFSDICPFKKRQTDTKEQALDRLNLVLVHERGTKTDSQVKILKQTIQSALEHRREANRTEFEIGYSEQIKNGTVSAVPQLIVRISVSETKE